jgi:manganese oxidase
MNHATDGMAGLIVGVLVRPRGGAVSVAPPGPPRRTLRLFADQRAGVVPDDSTEYGFVLQDGDREPARDSVRRPGSPIVLRRGEPVQITVFNRLTVPLAVHWHGLELDSYFDGVGDWSGSVESIARPIVPGDSFVVRLSPPRAGTFMYHVHGEEGDELAFGLYGPLIVRDGPAALDTLRDRILLVSDPGLRPAARVLVNGSPAPRITMTAGVAYRLRVIGIRSNGTTELGILRGAEMTQWRLLARDGAELSGAPEPLTPALRLVGPGTIADYEYTPTEPGTLTLRLVTPAAAAVRDTVAIPITVLAPAPSLGAQPAARARRP